MRPIAAACSWARCGRAIRRMRSRMVNRHDDSAEIEVATGCALDLNSHHHHFAATSGARDHVRTCVREVCKTPGPLPSDERTVSASITEDYRLPPPCDAAAITHVRDQVRTASAPRRCRVVPSTACFSGPGLAFIRRVRARCDRPRHSAAHDPSSRTWSAPVSHRSPHSCWR